MSTRKDSFKPQFKCRDLALTEASHQLSPSNSSSPRKHIASASESNCLLRSSNKLICSASRMAAQQRRPTHFRCSSMDPAARSLYSPKCPAIVSKEIYSLLTPHSTMQSIYQSSRIKSIRCGFPNSISTEKVSAADD